MQILVTGSQGGIGSRLIPVLEAAGHTVRATDQKEGAENVADLTDWAAVRELVAGVDAVAHLGAIPGPVKGQEERVLASNAQGTWNVLLACVEHGVQRAVCFSSVNAFGSFGGLRPVPYLPGDDACPFDTHNVYQLAKHLVETVGDFFVRNHGMTVLCPRPVFVAQERHYEWFGHEHKDPPNAGTLTDLFSYVDVRDVCDATLRALTHDVSGFVPFLLSADDTNSVLTTEEIVARYYADTPWVTGIKAWVADNPHRALIDCKTAKTVLGWQPQHSWREGK